MTSGIVRCDVTTESPDVFTSPRWTVALSLVQWTRGGGMDTPWQVSFTEEPLNTTSPCSRGFVIDGSAEWDGGDSQLVADKEGWPLLCSSLIPTYREPSHLLPWRHSQPRLQPNRCTARRRLTSRFSAPGSCCGSESAATHRWPVRFWSRSKTALDFRWPRTSD